MSEKSERAEAPKPVFVFGDNGTTMAFEDYAIKLPALLSEGNDVGVLLFTLNLQLAQLHKIQVATLSVIAESAQKADQHDPVASMQTAMKVFMDLMASNAKTPIELAKG
jgi:hypothetical protein